MYREKVGYLYGYLMNGGQNSQRWFLKLFYLLVSSFCSSSRMRILSMKSTCSFSLFRIWLFFLVNFYQINFNSFSIASARVNQIFHFLLTLLWRVVSHIQDFGDATVSLAGDAAYPAGDATSPSGDAVIFY